MSDVIQKLRKEIERLQGFLSRIPTTADGVPIIQDTDYWLKNDGGEPIMIHTEVAGPTIMCREGVYFTNEMHSSREAAEMT